MALFASSALTMGRWFALTARSSAVAPSCIHRNDRDQWGERHIRQVRVEVEG